MDKCDLCHAEKDPNVLGKNCKVCGMPLKDSSREFCSKICRAKYNDAKK